VLERLEGEPRARCVDGRRAGPPEDCGGVGGFEELVASGEYVADFDLAETDDQVRNALERAHGVPPLVAELLQLVRPGIVLDQLYELVLRAALTAVPLVDSQTAERMVARYRWLIDRLGVDGVQLTSAGYLPPSVVEEALTALKFERWAGKGKREQRTPPVRFLRESAQALGLVRKAKGRLTATAKARSLAADPVGLWRHVTAHLPLGRDGTAQRHASVLALLWTAGGRSVDVEKFDDFAVGAMTEIGWRADDRAFNVWDLTHLMHPVVAVLDAMSSFERQGLFERRVTPDGVLLARWALVTGG
jgi:hypothetical protein